MVIIELFNTGLLYMFLCFSEPYIWIPAYFCLLLGLIIQFVLLKKCQKKFWHKVIFVMGSIGIVICECLWHLVTGWGKFCVIMVCLLFIAFLVGTVIARIVYFIETKRKLSTK